MLPLVCFGREGGWEGTLLDELADVIAPFDTVADGDIISWDNTLKVWGLTTVSTLESDPNAILTNGTRSLTGNWLNGNYTIATLGNVGIGTTSPGAKLDVNGAGIFDTVQFSHLSATKSDTYNVLTTDKGKTLVMDTVTKTFNLPSVDATNVGLWFTFVKLNAGSLIIDAADSDLINDSSAGGTIYDAQTNETYATIIIELVSATQWTAYGGVGTWTTN